MQALFNSSESCEGDAVNTPPISGCSVSFRVPAVSGLARFGLATVLVTAPELNSREKPGSPTRFDVTHSHLRSVVRLLIVLGYGRLKVEEARVTV